MHGPQARLWDGVADSLPPESRYRLAYLFGHRMAQLRKPDEAVRFLKIVAKEARPDSRLAELARRELMEWEH